MNLHLPAVRGASVGLGLGLAFVTSFNTGLDFLAPVLVWPAFPCWWVARMSAPHVHEGIAWALGVLTMGLLGFLVVGVAGRVAGWRRSRSVAGAAAGN